MKDYQFRAITGQDIPSMTRLLMARQERESQLFPFLKNSFLQTGRIAEQLQSLLASGNALGMGVFFHGQLVGYLVGTIRIDTRTGRCVVVPYEGAAIAEDQPTELIRHLYAEASVPWLDHGCFTHSAFVPLAASRYLEAFSKLSFGMEQVYAVLDLEEYRPFKKAAEVGIRLATEEDSEMMGRMASIISKHQNAAPTFIPVFPEILAEIREGFQRSLQDQDTVVLLAEKDGEAVGFHMYIAASPSIMAPDRSVQLVVAGTVQGHRRSGIGQSLMDAGCRMMQDKGYRYVTTDWRITNLASSTFWPKCGFRPIAYRMARAIDPNYAWANLNNPCVQQF